MAAGDHVDEALDGLSALEAAVAVLLQAGVDDR
jgi:hypothetical protein